MRKRRRQLVIRILEWLGAGLVVLDLVLYFAVYRPAGFVVSKELERFTAVRRALHEEQGRVDRLEKFRQAIPNADEKVGLFKREHVPPRRRGFSRAARLVRQVTEESGIQLSSISYKLSSAHKEPLERLGLDISVEGSYPGLIKFAHALETASDFILIHEFRFQSIEGGALALRLAADLYLTP